MFSKSWCNGPFSDTNSSKFPLIFWTGWFHNSEQNEACHSYPSAFITGFCCALETFLRKTLCFPPQRLLRGTDLYQSMSNFIVYRQVLCIGSSESHLYSFMTIYASHSWHWSYRASSRHALHFPTCSMAPSPAFLTFMCSLPLSLSDLVLQLSIEFFLPCCLQRGNLQSMPWEPLGQSWHGLWPLTTGIIPKPVIKTCSLVF